jgi:hypothetical protein
MPSMKRIAFALLASLTLATSGCAVSGTRDPYFGVTVSPPPRHVEYRGMPPGHGHLWISGYWHWGGGRYVWVPGYWQPPRVGPHWRSRGDYWEHSYRDHHAQPRPRHFDHHERKHYRDDRYRSRDRRSHYNDWR